MKKYKGAIFDIDGTLLDSMPIWDNVAVIYLESRGVKPRPGLNDELLKLGGHEIPQYFRVEYGIKESVDEIKHAIQSLLEDFYHNAAPLKDGVISLLEELSSDGVKMCVATATDRYLIKPALERCGIIDFFERIFTCGEEKTSKNNPDIYIRAAKFLGTGISDTIVFEDALYAIKSAKKAGFAVAGVYDLAFLENQDEIKGICDYYFESLLELTI